MRNRGILPTTLLACATVAVSAEAQRPIELAPEPEPENCAPAALVDGDASAAVKDLLDDRGVHEPAEGCPAIEARIEHNGVGLTVTMLDGDQTPRKAGTPEVAARMVQEQANRTFLAPNVPFSPVILPNLELAPIAETEPDPAGPWLEPTQQALSPGGSFDFWESVALDDKLGGPVSIEGFSLRAGGFMAAPVTYFDVPFAFGVGAATDVNFPVSGGGARIIADVPDPSAPFDFVSVGAGYARIGALVPFDGLTGTNVAPNDTLRVVHFGIGWDLGKPEP